MGLRQGTKRTFVRLKDGRFYKSDDKEYTTPYDELQGRIVSMDIKAEVYNNKPLEKLYVDIDDGENVFSLGIPFDATYTTKFLSFLKNADLTEPLSLHPSMKKDGDKEVRNIFIEQDGKHLKSAYTKDSTEVPKMKKLKSGKWDKEDFLEFYRELVLKEFKPVLAHAKALPKTEEEVEIVDGEDSEEDAKDKMPF